MMRVVGHHVIVMHVTHRLRVLSKLSLNIPASNTYVCSDSFFFCISLPAPGAMSKIWQQHYITITLPSFAASANYRELAMGAGHHNSF